VCINIEIRINSGHEEIRTNGIVEMLRLNVPMALKLAFDGLKGSHYKTSATFVDGGDVSKFRSVELFVLLCRNEHIRKVNRSKFGLHLSAFFYPHVSLHHQRLRNLHKIS